MIEKFTAKPEDSLGVQIGRPIGAWWDNYYAGAANGIVPDRFLLAENRGFTEELRGRAAEVVGTGPAADAAAVLLSMGGMVARDMDDLDHALAQIADWYGYYSPREIRRQIASEVLAAKREHAERRSTVRGRVAAALAGAIDPDHPMMRPGTRQFPYAGTLAVLAIDDEGLMTFGLVHDGFVRFISRIDDRDGGGRSGSHAPAPEPELVN